MPRLTISSFLEMLLAARTAGFRVLSPAESLTRRFTRREPLPPLWLRRHTGAPGQFRQAARLTAERLEELDLVQPDGRILDVGCGCGAMAFELQRRLSPRGLYVGLDVHGPSVRWCERFFAGDQRLRFELASIDSPYTRGVGRHKTPTRSFRFPLESASIDLVIAKSLFTHMLPTELRHYLGEMRRVLAPGGAVFATFFLFAAGGETPVFPYPLSPHGKTSSAIRWRRRYRPHAAIAYERTALEQAVREAGFEIRHLVEDFWPGDGENLRGQDQLVLGLADERVLA